MLNLQGINDNIDRYLEYPGIDQETLIRKKLTWIWTVSVSFAIVLMTFFAFFMDVRILVWYGIILLVYYAIVIPLIRELRNYELLIFIFLLLVIFTTFITILKLGGIVYSMGLVFVGLTCAMSSLLLSRIKWIIFIFIFYALTIIIAGFLQPYLETPVENTPSKNLIFYIVNIIWISGSTLNFTVDYIKQRSKFEEERASSLKDLNETKTRLYTNITHEFRTPLTIILGIANQIKEKPKEILTNGLDLITRNGKTLLNLVNNMLDLQKIEAGAMQSHIIQGDIIPFLAYVTTSFSPLADAKKIKLKFEPKLDSLIMDYDPDSLQKVLFNILSNAIKFTSEKGNVCVKVEKVSQDLIIKVTDSGIGISEDDLPRIFDRFYQSKKVSTDYTGGTGIGLALTYELVKLIGGKIFVSSIPNKGTTFTISFPINHLAPMQSLSFEDLNNLHLNLEPDQVRDPIPQTRNSTSNGKPILLIVEDNMDMINYLSLCLQGAYHLEFSFNGKQGIEKALEIIPDIIISDVMMPEYSGFELCSKLKNDFRTSHIPIVLLTAKGDIASKIEGFGSGADAYLTKPFYKKELFVRLQKLIELRKTLQSRYSSNEVLLPSKDKSIQQEDKFMKRVRNIAEANISDENFGVSQLCQELAMSRAQLYRKFEALTDIQIGKFIRLMRLRKAKALLEETDLNVTEAAFESGFRNLSHFSTAFKEEFGFSPREVRH